MTAHAFDNFPVEKWQEAFKRHFARTRLSLVLTGGETLIDRKSIVLFLNFVSTMPTTECIRIDTNVCWKPSLYEELDRSKLILMCSYHPSQVEEDVFFSRIKDVLSSGFRIGIVNYVMSGENIEAFRRLKQRAAQLGVVFQPNPLWNSAGRYSHEDLELLRVELLPLDFQYRTQMESPMGKTCRFPMLAYEMDVVGNITVGCHNQLHGSFFDKFLPPLKKSRTPCPHHVCACLDKYSFLDGVHRNTSTDPLGTYSSLLRQRAATPT
jgi:hypothetical protein